MKILVTGGAGFIGSNVVDAYIEAGHEVTVLDNLRSGNPDNLNPKAEFHLMDVRNEEVKKLFAIEHFDIINHHAAQMSVPASVEDPLYDADVNVRGFINILEAARTNGTKKIIFISSGGAIYGEAEQFPATENCPTNPLSPYAITKLVSENYLKFYNHQYGLDYTTLRYANIYGPRQVPHGEAGVVAIFMDRLLEEKQCTLYHFESEPRGMTRDYCYVGDVARANLLALDRGSRGAFNIGTGVETHTEDLFKRIHSSISKKTELRGGLDILLRNKARAGDIKKSCLNAEHASEGLGWKPHVELSEGLKKTMEWRLD